MKMSKRISQIFLARANAALDRMEDPRETIDYFYQTQLEELVKRRRMFKDMEDTRERIGAQINQLEQVKSELTTSVPDRHNIESATRLAATERNIASLRRRYNDATMQVRQVSQENAVLMSLVESFRTYKEMIKADYNLAIGAKQTSISSDRGKHADHTDEIDDDDACKLGQILDLLSPESSP